MVSHVVTSASAGSARSFPVVVQAVAWVGKEVVVIDAGGEVEQGLQVATDSCDNYT